MSVLGSQLTFPSDEGKTLGYMARHDESDNYPGVVVIQEWWGLVPHNKEVVDRFAGQGFFAVALDLYHGPMESDPRLVQPILDIKLISWHQCAIGWE